MRRGKATEPDDGRPRRLPLDVRNAVVRVEVPTATAADLTPRQLATARELGVPDLAKYAGALALHNARRENGESFEPRRANEPTGGVILRRRHHDALAFARWLVLELVALRPIAEAAPVLEPDASTAPDAWQLARLIETVERARSHWTHDGRTDEAPRRIGAVRDALEHARQWHAQRVNETTSLAARVKALVDREGVSAAARTLGVSREAVARLAGGLDVRRGTVALAEKSLATLDAAKGEA